MIMSFYDTLCTRGIDDHANDVQCLNAIRDAHETMDAIATRVASHMMNNTTHKKTHDDFYFIALAVMMGDDARGTGTSRACYNDVAQCVDAFANDKIGE
jgi:hypothetical protein